MNNVLMQRFNDDLKVGIILRDDRVGLNPKQLFPEVIQ